MWVPVAVWQPCELLYSCYLLTYLLTEYEHYYNWQSYLPAIKLGSASPPTRARDAYKTLGTALLGYWVPFSPQSSLRNSHRWNEDCIQRYVLTVPHSWHASVGQNASNRCWKRLQRRRLRIASKHYMLEHSNSRFESILFDSLCSTICTYRYVPSFNTCFVYSEVWRHSWLQASQADSRQFRSQ